LPGKDGWLPKKRIRNMIITKTAENSKDTAFHFLVIKNKNYDHNSKYILPVKPSPNIPEIQSVYLYPSTCFFEGTVLSEGRGTDKPFEKFGHPLLPTIFIHLHQSQMKALRIPSIILKNVMAGIYPAHRKKY
jgi:uncharacterized protein YbbC (DUF1343 family)